MISLLCPSQGVKGFYKLQKRKAATGKLVQELEFENIITNVGLTQWCTGGILDYAFAGTGTVTPSVLDTQLGAYIGYNTGGSPAQNRSDSGYPHATPYIQFTRTFRCNPGAVTGNLTEVGVGWSTAGSPNGSTHRVFSRALIVDGGGTPVTLTILSDEYLDITYSLRLFAPANAADATYNITISGITYAVTSKVASFPGSWQLALDSFASLNGAWSGYIAASTYPSSSVLGAVTAGPTGTELTYAATGSSAATHSAGTITRTVSLTAALGEGNSAGGIGCMSLAFAPSSSVYSQTQFAFVPAIPKTSTKVMTLNLTQTIVRI